MLRFWHSLVPHWGKITAIAFAISIGVILTVFLLWSQIPSGTFLVYPHSKFMIVLGVIFLAGLLISAIGWIMGASHNRTWVVKAFLAGIGITIFMCVLLFLITPSVLGFPIHETFGMLRDGTTSYHLAWHGRDKLFWQQEGGKLVIYRCEFLDFNCKQLYSYPETGWIGYPYFPTVKRQGNALAILSHRQDSPPETWAELSLNGNLLTLEYQDEIVYVGEVE